MTPETQKRKQRFGHEAQANADRLDTLVLGRRG